ncbi:putative sensor protein [Cohnella sp. SGD-V74]|uniref:sensor domain-containing protein n=1 Tax=unclassified Cohnella TaxID=2636738 RepID=UPI000D4B0584|nr:MULTISPECIES: sensor domain-containing protein [unclassified Cohnella]PRX60904.1 putative sensor protein [Cohnella sp. SGD-V74]
MKITGWTQAIVSWKLLLGSLPRGIVAFVIAVAGLSVGLPLAVFAIGLPILAGMLAACERILDMDRRLIAAWESPQAKSPALRFGLQETIADLRKEGWRGWLGVLRDARQYRSLAYGIGHFPVSILAFVLALVIPVTAAALLLSPAAELVSSRMFSFSLFEDDLIMQWIFPEWSSFQRSWFNTGLGVLLLLATPFLLRKLSACYASWIRWISGAPSHT